MITSVGRAAGVSLLFVALVIAVGCLLDASARHGWTATYYYPADAATLDRERQVVVELTEPWPSYLNEYRARSRYETYWDHSRYSIPAASPEFHVVLRGTLSLDEPRRVRVTTRNEAEAWVGGQPLAVEPLPAGEHEIRIEWRGQFDSPLEPARGAGLRVEWSTLPDPESPDHEIEWERIPAEAITPTTSFPNQRIALWIAIAVLCLVTGFGTFVTVRAPDHATRRRRFARLATALILMAGVSLRLVGYDVSPHPGETSDEYFAAWNGWQLLEDGTTVGWTTFGQSYDPNYVELSRQDFWGREFIIVSPYLEHPPLMHLLVGAAAKVGGAEHWSQAKHVHFRIVPILLNAVALWLVLAIGQRVFPKGPAPWCAGVIYAVIPIVCLQARLAKEESLLTTVALLSTYLFLRWRDGGRSMWLVILAAAVASLAGWAKVPGFAFVLGLAVLVGRHHVRQGLVVLGIGAAFAVLFYAYGYWMGWEVFQRITDLQGALRHGHWNVFTKYFHTSIITHNQIGKGWLLYLWMAFALGVANRRDPIDAAIVVPPVFYLITIGIAAASWHFGWYPFPLYPFLAIGAGKNLADLYEKPDLFRAFPLFALGIMYGLNFTVPMAELGTADVLLEHQGIVLWALGLAFMVYLGTHAIRSPAMLRVARTTTIAGTIAFVFLSGRFVMDYDQHFQEYYQFDVRRSVR